MNDHAFALYLRHVLQTEPRHREAVLAGLRANDRGDLADAAEETWRSQDDADADTERRDRGGA